MSSAQNYSSERGCDNRECPACAAVSDINNQFVFVKKPENLNCIYCLPFGDAFICTCQKRIQIKKPNQI